MRIDLHCDGVETAPGLRDYVALGTKIHRTLLVPLVNGRLARGYTADDVALIEDRLKFVPIFVEEAKR